MNRAQEIIQLCEQSHPDWSSVFISDDDAEIITGISRESASQDEFRRRMAEYLRRTYGDVFPNPTDIADWFITTYNLLW